MPQPSPDAIGFIFEDEEETDESLDEFRHDHNRRGNVHIAGTCTRMTHHQHESRILKAQNHASEILVATPYLNKQGGYNDEATTENSY